MRKSQNINYDVEIINPSTCKVLKKEDSNYSEVLEKLEIMSQYAQLISLNHELLKNNIITEEQHRKMIIEISKKYSAI